MQVNDQSGLQGGRQPCAQLQGGGFVVQCQGQGSSGIIAAMHEQDTPDWQALATRIKGWGRELGFDDIAIVAAQSDAAAEAGLLAWLAEGCHGDMDYMARHGLKRARPAELMEGARSLIMARVNYWPEAADARANLAAGERAYISRYALGRDYHKLLRNRLQKLATRIEAAVGEYSYRAFSDSAPLMEISFASRGGLGWRGKHSLLLTREAGSAFFLGEIVCSLPLPADELVTDHCGSCSACISACPTAAIVAPYRVDARRCISYLTIEHGGSIPEELRPLMGNRIYGCDDCQLICPWFRKAEPQQSHREADFAPRHGLDRATLVELFAWTEEEFKARLAGSPIYRIGHERWLRNIAVALGNAPTSESLLAALQSRRNDVSALVREHVVWALARHGAG